jgi:hypothetical protein
MGCRRTEDVRHQVGEKELAFGDYGDGRFAWFFELKSTFGKPYPAKGHLGIWNWTPPAPFNLDALPSHYVHTSRF